VSGSPVGAMPSLVERMVRTKGFKVLSLLLGALFFGWLDTRLDLPPWPPRPLGFLSGLVLVVLGLLLAGWSVWAQLKLGRGGPLPVAPTQRLVTMGPYALCRNPMVLGEFLYLTGLGLLLASPSFLALTWLAFFPVVVAYLKLVEEKELEARFGEAYLAYKRRVPLLIPRPRRGRRHNG